MHLQCEIWTYVHLVWGVTQGVGKKRKGQKEFADLFFL